MACFSINAEIVLACEYTTMRLVHHTATGSNSLCIIISDVVVDPSEVGVGLFGRIGRLQILESPSNHAVAEQTWE